MTKLQLLHRALNERLMAAVEQIMEMVGGTVLEYEEETVRARKENEVLRRRLRWMEGEIPTDWPDEADLPGPEQPNTLENGSVQESLLIKTEPTDTFDSQPIRPDSSFKASLCTADLEAGNPGTSELSDASVPQGVVWDSTQSYMAPLDFDPTMGGHWKGRGRSQRMSFACPDCGKVFGREQRLIFHMRIHSAERPYTYRRRKACFYGDKQRKKKLCDLSRVYSSREITEELSNTSEKTESSAASGSLSIPAVAPRVPEGKPGEESNEATEDAGSSKYPERGSAKPEVHRGRTGPRRSKIHQCLKCKKVFKRLSQLALHMKTHNTQFSTQEKQKDQEDAGKKPRQYRKKRAMRNNETEVKRTRAGSQSVFQCLECKKIFARSCWLTFHLKSHERERALACKEKKQLPSDKMQKNFSTEIKAKAKETVTENSSTQVLKKTFPCPYCDKVFTREGWLAPHIQSHTVKKPRKSDLPFQSTLPDFIQRKARRTISRLSKEGSDGRKRAAEESEKCTEQPAKIIKAKQITAETKRDSESKTSRFESITNGSSEITEDLQKIPEGSTEAGGSIKRSRKKFYCQECGKVYLLAGCLKRHKKIHKRERIQEENRRQRRMNELEQKERQTEEQCVTENIMENIVEKKQKKKKKLLAVQHNLNTGPASKQDGVGMPSKEKEDTSCDVQASENKNEEPLKKNNGRYICSHCGKLYARKNWLKLHMLGHRDAMMTLQTEVNDKKGENDTQLPQEGSSTEDSTVQKGKDGGKALYPCPFCDKVFRRGMRLMMHMQIHSGEKPYSYRERKEQFYGDLTRQRVPHTLSQEPAVENNGERKKDGGFAVTRNQTSAVSQDHTSTTEPMESVQPLSVHSGRKYGRLLLKSAGAASNHRMKQLRTDLKSVRSAICRINLQPRIVLKPIVAESKSLPSPGKSDFRPVSAEIGDNDLHLTSDAKTETENAVTRLGKLHLPQNPLENSNNYDSRNMSSGINCTVISETNDPDIVCVVLDSDFGSYENTSLHEQRLISIGDRQTTESLEGRKSKFWQKDGLEGNLDYSLLNVKQTTDKSKLEARAAEPDHLKATVCKTSSVTTGCDIPSLSLFKNGGPFQAEIIDDNSDDKLQADFISTKSNSTALQKGTVQDSVCMILSDVNSDDDDGGAGVDDGDDNWSNMSYDLHKKSISTGSRVQTPFISSSLKATDGVSQVEFIPDKTKELHVYGGLLSNRNEIDGVTASIQQTKENSKGQKSRSTCLICGLMFAGSTSLSLHMQVHSSQGYTGKITSTFNTEKSCEMKNKQEIIQPTRVDKDLSDKVESVKVHTCQHCTATFCSPYHLRRHVYTHTGERPYWCSLCNLGFIQKYRLRNHRMTYHGGMQSSLDMDLAKKPQTRSDITVHGEVCEQPSPKSLGIQCGTTL